MADFPFAIIDAHHHFWDLQKVHYPWLEARGVKRFFGDPTAIQKNYLAQDLRNDFDGLPVGQSVHIQVGAADSQHLAEAQLAQSISDESGLANAIVAFVALENPSRTDAIEQLKQLSNFRGVRQIVGRSPEEDAKSGTGTLLERADWRSGLNLLAENGLSFDLQLIPEQMQVAARLFSGIPELKVALCHCGSPWYNEMSNPKGWALWNEGLETLADLPNVHCKISGLTMFNHNWSIESFMPVISTVIKTFGPDRCMFGSNFPVDKLHASYTDLWHAYLSICRALELSDQQMTKLFSSNCSEFYRLN